MPEAIGHVNFSFSSSLRPWDGDPEQYWIEVTGRILARISHHPYRKRLPSVG